MSHTQDPDADTKVQAQVVQNICKKKTNRLTDGEKRAEVKTRISVRTQASNPTVHRQIQKSNEQAKVQKTVRLNSKSWGGKDKLAKKEKGAHGSGGPTVCG